MSAFGKFVTSYGSVVRTASPPSPPCGSDHPPNTLPPCAHFGLSERAFSTAAFSRKYPKNTLCVWGMLQKAEVVQFPERVKSTA